jgi:hypothetical protein
MEAGEAFDRKPLKTPMKKATLLIALVFVVIQLPVFAQIRFEAFAGPSWTTLRGVQIVGDVEKIAYRITVSGGLGAIVPLTRHSYIIPQVILEGKGMAAQGRISIDNNSYPFRYDLKLEYLTIPVRYGYEFGQRVKTRIEAGPYVSILLRARDITKIDSPGSQPYSYNDRGNFKNTDVGVSSRIHVSYSVNDRFSLQMSVLVNIGLTNINGVHTSGSSNLKNTSHGLQAGIVYAI